MQQKGVPAEVIEEFLGSVSIDDESNMTSRRD
jgi:hypothetical protein